MRGERTAWLRVLRHNSSLPPLAGLDGAAELSDRASDGGGGGADAKGAGAEGKKLQKGRSRLGNMALRAEDYMVTRAVTSELGKKLLREYCIPETFQLLDALKELVGKDPLLPPKTGQQIENTILRVAVKLTLQFQHKQLTPRHFDRLTTMAD